MCIQSAVAAAAATAAAAILLLLLQQQCCCFLLLFVIVCRMAKFGAGSSNLIPVLFFSSFKRDIFSMNPSTVLLCRSYGLDSSTFSVVAGMRGAKVGVIPPRRSPPCTSTRKRVRTRPIVSLQRSASGSLAEPCGKLLTTVRSCGQQYTTTLLYLRMRSMGIPTPAAEVKLINNLRIEIVVLVVLLTIFSTVVVAQSLPSVSEHFLRATVITQIESTSAAVSLVAVFLHAGPHFFLQQQRGIVLTEPDRSDG